MPIHVVQSTFEKPLLLGLVFTISDVIHSKEKEKKIIFKFHANYYIYKLED